jgi:hypothetical protein
MLQKLLKVSSLDSKSRLVTVVPTTSVLLRADMWIHIVVGRFELFFFLQNYPLLNKTYFKFKLTLSRNLPSKVILPQVFILLWNCYNSFKRFELDPCYWECFCSKIAWLTYSRHVVGPCLIVLFVNHFCSLLYLKFEASCIIAGEENTPTEQF